MGSISDYLENAWVNHLVGTAYTQPATVYLALATADPGDAATGASCNECANANNYARVACTFGTAASRAIAAAQKVAVSVIVSGTLMVDYALYEMALRLLEESGAKCDTPVFTDKVTVPFRVLAGGEENLLPKLQELCRGVPEITLSKPFYAPF